MTLTDYLINAIFVVVVLRQARERRLDPRSFVAPMAMVAFVAVHYVQSIPTGGGDLGLVAALTSLGLSLGVASGLATHVRADGDGIAYARVGWLAGLLLVAGISSRLVFVFALDHGAGQAVRDFSIANHVSAAAWPVALVSMALFEVTTRLVLVQLRGGAWWCRGGQSRSTACLRDGGRFGSWSGWLRRAERGSMGDAARGRWWRRRGGDAVHA